MVPTREQLRRIYPSANFKTMATFYTPLMEAMDEFEITNRLRVAMFLAQVGEESGQLHFTKEIWGPSPAQLRYEGRKDLGNVNPGDGFRFRGRGLLQVTGRDGYRLCSIGLYGDESVLQEHPEFLEDVQIACRSAGWVWRDFKKLNPVADSGDFERTTRRINGGLTHQERRMHIYKRALDVLPAE